MKTREVSVGKLRLGGSHDLLLIAGPCVIESPEACLEAARRVQAVAQAAGMPLVFKASFDKANRSSGASFRGLGQDPRVRLQAGLAVLRSIQQELGLPILTDIHEAWQAEPVAEVADVLQIPALLCRQTDLLFAAGQTGKPVNIKKGQFLAPDDLRHAVEKVRSTGNERILLTERGTSFGYHCLVNDMRSLPALRRLGYPVVFDATHSVQLPGGLGHRSGGERHFVPALARAAVAAGVDGVFLEVHPDPDRALSDGPNMLRLDALPPLLDVLQRIHREVRASVEAESGEAEEQE